MSEYVSVGLVVMAIAAWAWGIYSYARDTKEHCAGE
jgi:hypothetical protein